MRIGASLFLIAVGAILKFAITAQVDWVNLSVVGVILMVVGFMGLVITVVWMWTRKRTEVIQHGPTGTTGTTYVTPHDERDRPR